MARIIHVICGDPGSLVEGLADSLGDVVALRDSLSSGPLRVFRDAESWRAARLAFREHLYYATTEGAKARRNWVKAGRNNNIYKLVLVNMAQNSMTCILCFLRFLLFQDETYTMHPNFAKADRLSGEVIGAAILVHRIMGPGLLESI